MKATKDTLTKPSETEKVNAYMKALKIFVEGLRQIILSTDHEIGKRSNGMPRRSFAQEQ